MEHIGGGFKGRGVVSSEANIYGPAMDIATRMKLAGMVGLVGGAVWLTLALAHPLEIMSSTLCAAAGGVVGGAVCAALFGRPSREGWFFALTGACLSTGLGASIGGFLSALLFGEPKMALLAVGLGPILVSQFLVITWQAAAVWAAAFIAIHLAARSMRGGVAHANGNDEGRGFTP